MKRREKILALLLGVAVVGWFGMPILHKMVLGRLEEDSRRLEDLKKKDQSLDDQEFQLQLGQRRMAEWRDRSLPPEPLDAQRLYQEWLNDLADLAGFTSLRVTPDPMQVAPSAAYRAVRVTVKGQATFEQLTTFLHEFERTDLLHRVQVLKVEAPPPPAPPGGPLKIVLTAEGLCLRDAPPRRRLFPRTELVDSLPASFDQLKVVSADDFPKEPGFDVHIDNEVVTVTKISGTNWTVKRAVEGTSKAYHRAKSEVELHPVKDGARNTTLDARRKLLASHPFVQPAVPPVRQPDSSDPARQTRLMATMVTDEEHSAWLYNQMTKSKTVVQKNSPIDIGDIQGTVVAIEATAIQIKRGNDLWEVPIGKDLRSMTRVVAGEAGGGGGGGGADDSLIPGMSDEVPAPRGAGRRFGGRGDGRDRSRRSRRPDMGDEADR